MKRFKSVLALALSLVITFGVTQSVFAGEYGKAKNIILMIPDGMSVESLTTARWMTDDYSFVMDEMATGMVRTNNSNTPIADSAPAGTAMATGVKTQSPYISTYPGTSTSMPGAEPFDSEKANMPLATILEGAERIGKSTGIISTSNVQHATPAVFSSHHPDRNQYEHLGEQQVYQNMEVVLGAGLKYLNNRKDGENLIQVIKDKGYDYVTDTAGLKTSNSSKIWGMFADKSMAYDIDRDSSKEPSLEEMTTKALEVLSKNNNGFFLMVEGSEVDWANHANDPVAVVSDVIAFDKAVKVAKDFADSNPGTALIIAADHGTGGITFGERAISSGYDKTPLEEFTKIIKNAKLTGQGAAALLNDDKSNIAQVMEDIYGIKDLTEEEIEYIKGGEELKEGMQQAIGTVIANRSHIGFTTNGHVGGDVTLYCYTSGSDIRPLTGTVHNAEIGKYMASLFDVDLEALTDKLYNEAEKAFKAKGAEVTLVTDESDISLIVEKGSKKVKFPAYKNIAIVDGKEIELEGLNVFNGEKMYVAEDALALIK